MPEKELTPAQRRIEAARQKLAKEAQARLDGTGFVLNPPPAPQQLVNALEHAKLHSRVDSAHFPERALGFHDADSEAARIDARRAESAERLRLQNQHRADADKAIAEREKAKADALADLKQRARAGEELTPVEELQLASLDSKRAAYIRSVNLL